MCGRYYVDLETKNELLARYLLEAQTRAEHSGVPMKVHGEVAPTDIVPVIATGAVSRAIGAYPMRWGYAPPTHRTLVFNTRSETAESKPLFSGSVQDRRCIVPAACYYEWKRMDAGKKEKYAFSAATGEPLYLAGLYLKDAAMALPCFTILTRDAADGLSEIHGRMPVILPEEAIGAWLDPAVRYADCLGRAVTQVTYKAC